MLMIMEGGDGMRIRVTTIKASQERKARALEAAIRKGREEKRLKAASVAQ
jgi:hypothetical protein